MSEARTDIAPAVEPTAPPVPEPTGPGTAAAAQEQLKATEKPPSTILTEAEKPAEAPKEAAAPEAFDPEKITFPEGITPDPELMGKFGEIAKTHGLTQPAAQQLVDLYNTVARSAADANRTAWNTTLSGWEAEVRADEQIAKTSLKSENGTVLQGLDAVKVIVARTILDDPEIGGPKLREALETTGGGSNPAIIRAFLKLGQMRMEGSAVRAGGPSPDAGSREASRPPTAARALYPNLP